MPELAFFIGKGGVGKTTLASAFAIRSAVRRRSERVLLISTDPAHSLADIFETKLGDSPATIKLGSSATLDAWEMNAAKLFRRFLARHKEELLSTIERGSFFTRDEIASLLDTSLPGMSEIAALLAIEDVMAAGKYARVVVDTAPFGHTLRLFDLPAQFLRLLDFLELAADRDRVLAQHFGGIVKAGRANFVEAWRARISDLQRVFASASVFLVTTAEKFALNESIRCAPELQKSNSQLKLKAIILNRVVTNPGKCALCRKKSEDARTAEKMLRREFPRVEQILAEDPGVPLTGLPALKQFAAGVFFNKPFKARPGKVSGKNVDLRLGKAQWPAIGPLSLVIGKGGVGKTTVSAGLAFHSRRRAGDTVEIHSVDPAPSLDDIFQTAVDGRPRPVLRDKHLLASEMDSVALFKEWVGEIRQEVESAVSSEHSGVHVDLSYERELFSQLLEIVPPGVDELLAVFRIADALGPQKKVVIDMAPTGHALELLRMPERILVWSRLLLKSLAGHRKLALAQTAAVKIAEMEVRARELSQMLQNATRTMICSVMLPEFLPDRETQRLLDSLQELKLPPETIFVNRMRFREAVATCRRCRRTADAQAEVLVGLRKRLPGRKIYVIRDFGHEIAGVRGLRQLTGELWQLS